MSFIPDAKIIIEIISKGSRPAKFAYLIDIQDKIKDVGVKMEGFLGKTSLKEAQAKTLLLALEQAARLKKRKLDLKLCGVSWLDPEKLIHSRTSNPELKLTFESIILVLNQFSHIRFS